MTNYYAPQFEVTVNGTELNAEISGNIQTISVTKAVKSHDDKCTLTIANATPRMRWTHSDDAHLFWIGGEVKVKLGYAEDFANLPYMLEGKISAVKAAFPNSGVPTITVDCDSAVQQLHGDQKTTVFKSMTDKQIVEQIAQTAGLQVEVEDTGITYDYLIQPNQTDFQFLRARAELLHYEMLIKEKTLIFRKSKEADDKTYTFVWAPSKSFAPRSPNTLPLKSFDIQGNVNTQFTATQTRSWDPKTKKAIVGQADSGQEDTTMSGTKVGSQERKSAAGPRQRTDVSHPANSSDELSKRANADLNKKGQDYLAGTVHTIGVPDLHPGTVVYLDGVGLFCGKYYVGDVTHTIGNNGYSTDFHVQRNSTNVS